jgi:ATP-binding cassette subfamily B protein RaxB
MTSNLNFRFSRGAKLPILLQEESSECGHVCVAMVSHYFGHDIDLYHLRKMSPTSALGMSLMGIKQLCQRLGLLTRALRVPLEELARVKTPAILHWNMNHFVVLKQVKNNQYIIHDPALGRQTYSQAEVSAAFTGIVLELEKSDDFHAIRQKEKLTLFDLVKSIHGIKAFWVLVMILSILLESLHLLSPLFMQYVTDDVIATLDSNNLSWIAIGFVLLLGLQVFIEWLRGNMVIYLSTELQAQFSSNLLNHLLKLPLHFFEKRHKGDIQSKFQSIDQIQRKISVDFINALLDGLLIIIHLAVMFLYSLKLTLLVLSSIALYFAIRYMSYQSLKKYTQTSICQHAKAATIFLETLQALVPIKSFLKEGMRLQTWRNSYIQALNSDIVLSKMQVIYQVVNQIVFQAEHIVVVSVGALMVLSNQLSLGMLLAFLAYRMLLVNKASSLIQHGFDYQLISVQLTRLADVILQEPEHQSSTIEASLALPNALVKAQSSLSLKNISFRYGPQDPYILQGIHLEVKAGEKLAIIGPSGCGKSTLIKIMMGLLQPTEGEISIDNQSLENWGLRNYRQITASVMQDDALLSGSLLDNIVFFDEEVDIEAVYTAAKAAAIHDTIMALPMRYETLVGDMGSTLSGGQRQRLLLARALYKKPKFLFLDEATSHLDGENEIAINQSLKALEITQIIIAHREESIKLADRVVNLEILKSQSCKN